MRRVIVFVLSGALLLGPAACGGGGGGGKPEPARSSGTGGTPAGGWPQGENGVLDGRMCAILTPDDFQKVHMTTGTPEVSDFQPEQQRIGVTCDYGLNDTLSLGLYPGPAGARALYFTLFGRFQRARTDPVAGADESIFGADTVMTGAYGLALRRGRLILVINLDPKINKFTEDEARTAAVTLAGLVLERAPRLGR